MKFSEVIGQQDVKERLLQMVREERIPNSIMLCGPTGCGKLPLALAFASYLLGECNEEDTPQSRNTIAMLKKWEHPDLHFTYPVIRPKGTGSEHKMTSDDFTREWHHLLSNGTYFTMNKWLEEMNTDNQQAVIGAGESDLLIRKISLKSSQGGYKVSVIWLPERMNAECANKLLKMLEEPPHQTIFIMVCEEPELLLDTIKSRTQRIDVKGIETPEIERALIERRGIDDNSAHRIARVAGGSWIKALEELDTSNENNQFFDMFVMLMRLSYMRNIHDLRAWSDAVNAFGREKQKRMLIYFTRLVRENFIYNFHNSELNYMTQKEEEFSMNFARFINEANVIDISELLERAKRDIGQNANARIVFFDMALQMIVLLIRK